MVCLCTRADAYQSYTCVDAVILSLLLNPYLELQDTERQEELKERERAILDNQFNTKQVEEKSKAREAEDTSS